MPMSGLGCRVTCRAGKAGCRRSSARYSRSTSSTCGGPSHERDPARLEAPAQRMDDRPAGRRLPAAGGERQCPLALCRPDVAARLRAARPTGRRHRQTRAVQRGEVGLLRRRTMVHQIPAVMPPLPRHSGLARGYAPSAAFGWLAAGWRDLKTQPASSVAYGLGVFVVSLVVVGGFVRFGWDYILFPAFAGFMVIGPLLAVGLYEKSRRLAAGQSVRLADMIFVRPASGGQILFTGVLLCGLMLLWMRAAVIIYALFFGLLPFPGLNHIAPMLFTTPTGWALLIVGGAVGALFAAFSFAISVFAIPMLLNQRVDALTAMGTSTALVWNNLPVMLTWGAIVLGLFLLSLVTGLVGLIVAFPVLGHA